MRRGAKSQRQYGACLATAARGGSVRRAAWWRRSNQSCGSRTGRKCKSGRRGGPRLVGEPGTRAFGASDMAAIAARRAPEANTFHSVVAGYKASQDFQAAHEGRLSETHSAHRKAIRRSAACGARRRARHPRLSGMARRHGVKPASGRLLLDGSDAAVVVGAGEGTHALSAA
jgi:hypothetical protein